MVTKDAKKRSGRHMAMTTPNPVPIGVPVLMGGTLRHALPSGCTVLTARGDVSLETIAPGERIITRDHGMVPVRDVICFQTPEDARAVQFPTGSLGRNRPQQNLCLPFDQPVVLRGWRAKTLFHAHEARVAAVRLVDGAVIREVAAPRSTVWSIILDRPSAIYVNGMEVVSGAPLADGIATRNDPTG